MTDQSDFDSEAGLAVRQALSALADGELSDDAVDRVCASWRDDSQLRQTWHAFNVIGDVMRSEDLAGSVSRDALFLSALRDRLADEPVVLAPRPVPPPAKTPHRAALHPAAGQRVNGRGVWVIPAAVAAGFVMVLGSLLVISQAPQPSAAGATQAAQSVPAELLVAAPVPAASSPEFVASGEVIRDPQLDRYLSAHKQFSGSTVLGASSSFLRNAAAEAPAR